MPKQSPFLCGKKTNIHSIPFLQAQIFPVLYQVFCCNWLITALAATADENIISYHSPLSNTAAWCCRTSGAHPLAATELKSLFICLLLQFLFNIFGLKIQFAWLALNTKTWNAAHATYVWKELNSRTGEVNFRQNTHPRFWILGKKSLSHGTERSFLLFYYILFSHKKSLI